MRIGTCLARVHLHTIGHDKRRVEAHTELANQLRILFLVATQALQKGRRARFGDGAEVLDHLIPVHANAVVADRDGVGVLVDVDTDRVIALPFQQAVVGKRRKPELVDCVRGIGNQLTQENLLVAVQRMNHQVQQLAGLGLKTKRFFFHIRSHGSLASSDR